MENHSAPDSASPQKHALAPAPTPSALDERYDKLMGTLQQVRAQNKQVRMHFQDLVLQHQVLTHEHQQLVYRHQALHRQLTDKREVIQVLLPFYPYPLTPELRRKIES